MKNYDYVIVDNELLSDAVADFLNKNQFYIARHKRITTDELNAVRSQTGTLFTTLAFDGDKCIGMISAYPVASQRIPLKHQLFLGTLIIDKFYLIRPVLIKTLFQYAIKEVQKRNYREIISEVAPTNKVALHLLQRHGFVQLSETKSYYGHYELRNYLPAIFMFFGQENMNNEYVHRSFYDYRFLTQMNKKTKEKNYEFLTDNVIMQDFHLRAGSISLYINIDVAVVVGFAFANALSFVAADQNYQLVNNGETVEHISFSGNFGKIDKAVDPGERMNIEIDLYENIEVKYQNRLFFIHGLLIEKKQKGSNVNIVKNKQYKVILEKMTGKICVYAAFSDDLIMQIPLPHFGKAYIQGAIISEVRDLIFEYDKNELIITQKMADGDLRVAYVFKDLAIEMKASMLTDAKMMRDDKTLFTQIWTRGFIGGYEQKFDFSDYPFWQEATGEKTKQAAVVTANSNFQIISDQPLIINLPSIGIANTSNYQTNVAFCF